MNTPLELAADPQTSADVLYQLAAQYPEVRPVIAANPSAYPGLLEWLGQLGDAEVDMALAARAEWPVEETADQPVEGDEEVADPQDVVTEFEETSEAEVALDESEDLPGLTAAVAGLEEDQADEALTVELDQAVQQVENGEALEAADPETSPVRLQQLAAEFPHLRETILTNPACYPELTDWILSKHPELAEGAGFEDVEDEDFAATTQIDAITEDLSATVVAATAVPLPVPVPPLVQMPPPQVTDPGPSTRGLWTAFTILGVLAVASVTVALILIFQ